MCCRLFLLLCVGAMLLQAAEENWDAAAAARYLDQLAESATAASKEFVVLALTGAK